jgi:hypothetical protein
LFNVSHCPINQKSENLLELFSDLGTEASDKVTTFTFVCCFVVCSKRGCLQELLFSFLKHMPGTAREVSRFLKVFSSTEPHRFAVIKIGGAVVEENLDELAKQLAFLHRVGLYPTVVHGGGPQLNDALAKAGITHEVKIHLLPFRFICVFPLCLISPR